MTGRVLVVEDDAAIREHVATALADAGYDVTVATNGAEALEIMRGAMPRPDVMVVDLVMPVMTGRALLAACQDDPILADVRVIVTSASSAGTASAARDGYRVLRKPFTVERLLEVVASVTRTESRPPASERQQLENEIADLTISIDAATDQVARERMRRALHDARNRLTSVTLAEQLRRRRAGAL